jgi:hypothetical protein
MNKERECKICGKTYSLTEEFFHKRTDRGVSSFRKECRDCASKKARGKYEQDNKETIWEREKRLRREDEEHIRACSKCKKEWALTEEYFLKSPKSRHGLNTVCKECSKTYAKSRYSTEEQKLINSETQRAYRRTEKYKKWLKVYMNDPKVKQRQRANQERYIKAGNLNNYHKETYHANPKSKLRKTMSVNFRIQLNNIRTTKPLSTMKYIGCSVEELHIHLNTGKYTLKNYGEGDFHLDHIIPCAYYLDKLEIDSDGSITEETKPWLHQWWNYRNLRICPAKENQSKRDTMDYHLIEQHGIKDLLTID